MNLSDQPGVNDGGVQTASPHALDLAATRFSLANARELALYARMAYDEPPTIQDEGTDTQVLIRDLGDCIVVAFRGTSDARDFITDAECWMSYTSFGEIHSGFWRAWCSIHSQLFGALAQYSFKPVLMTGHSLGGALAQIAARAMRQQMVNVHSVYCFGAPRVGNKVFQREYNSLPMPKSPFVTLGDATFTLIHECDVVPRVPGWLAGYRRPGRDEFISAHGDIWEDPTVPLRLWSDLESLAAAWLARRNVSALADLITDHHIDNYIEALNAAGVSPAETSEVRQDAGRTL